MIHILFTFELLYLAILGVKVPWMARNTAWVASNGLEYRNELDRLRTMRPITRKIVTYSDIVSRIAQLGGGDLGVLGVKEFKLRAKIQRLKESDRLKDRLARWASSLFLFLFDFVSVAVMGGILLLAVAKFADPSERQGSIVVCLGIVTVFILLAAALLLLFDAAIQYARAGMYASALHNPLGYINLRKYSHFRQELYFLTGTALCALFLDSIAINYLSAAGYSFGVTDDLASVSPTSVFNSGYYAAMAFIISSELNPQDVLAKCVVLLISLQAIATFFLAVAGLLDAAKFKGGSP